MKALVLTHLSVPDPQRDVHGIHRRFGLFARALSRVAEVEILLFERVGDVASSDPDEAAARALAAWDVDAMVDVAPLNLGRRSPSDLFTLPFALAARGDHRPYLGAMQRAAARKALARQPDLVFAHRLSMFELVRLAGGTQAPVALDLDDIEHEAKLREARASRDARRRARALAELPALLAAERRAIRRATLSFVCSGEDRAKLAARLFDTRRVRVAPNAIDLPPMRAPIVASPTLLFLGSHGHLPNREAANRLVERIWPRILARLPQARLIIAGAQSETVRTSAKPPQGVEFAGFVDDLDRLYGRVRAVCCPIEMGGGTRIKLIEAAGRGKPIVSTRLGAEGLTFRAGREALFAETDAELAETAARLLVDDELADGLAEAAFRRAHARFEARAVEAGITAEFERLMRGDPAAPLRLSGGAEPAESFR